MTLGKAIKQMREELGLSQDEMASHLNIEANLIDTWETDKAQPTHEQLQIMADLFNIRIKDLINGRIPNITPELLPIAQDASFYKVARRFALLMAAAVSVLFLGAAAYVFFNVSNLYLMHRTVLLGVLLFVAMATATVAGLRYSWFSHRHLIVPPSEPKRLSAFARRFRIFITLAICFSLASVLWIFLAKEFLTVGNRMVISGSFCCLAVAAFLFVFFGILNGEYYFRDSDKRSRSRWDLTGRVCSTALILCTILYLFIGLVFRIWHPTWILFPIAGVFCGIYITGLPETPKK